MTHHGDPTEHEGSGPAEEPAGDREVDPAANPGPRGNPDVDQDRLEKAEEDLERTESH
jgi:hypothetical protein